MTDHTLQRTGSSARKDKQHPKDKGHKPSTEARGALPLGMRPSQCGLWLPGWGQHRNTAPWAGLTHPHFRSLGHWERCSQGPRGDRVAEAQAQEKLLHAQKPGNREKGRAWRRMHPSGYSPAMTTTSNQAPPLTANQLQCS